MSTVKWYRWGILSGYLVLSEAALHVPGRAVPRKRRDVPRNAMRYMSQGRRYIRAGAGIGLQLPFARLAER